MDNTITYKNNKKFIQSSDIKYIHIYIYIICKLYTIYIYYISNMNVPNPTSTSRNGSTYDPQFPSMYRNYHRKLYI